MNGKDRIQIDGIVLTPRMQSTLSQAARYARRYSHDYIGTEHVLLAFLNDDGGIGPSLIRHFGDGEKMRSGRAHPRDPARAHGAARVRRTVLSGDAKRLPFVS